jgi:hypothetical protein
MKEWTDEALKFLWAAVRSIPVINVSGLAKSRFL